MRRQTSISQARLHRKIGTVQRVLVDEIGKAGAIARSTADSPEIDGIVRIEDGQHLSPGDFADVTIHQAAEHDLAGRLAQPIPQA
jgi:ribosomal protein S12 methylthiotransferase